MNIAVFSDIHGNHVAFEVCMKYIENKNIDAYIFLGDYVGEFPGIGQTLDRIMELDRQDNCFVLRGNKEEYQLQGLGGDHPEWDEYPTTVGMFRYGSGCMNRERLAYIKTLPNTMRVEFPGLPALRLCHGSPRATRESIFPGEVLNRSIFESFEESYLLCGHTHGFLNFSEYGKTVWNPGSVGVTFGKKGTAEFMILHGDEERSEWTPEFINLQYNEEELIASMREEGFYEKAPYWTKISEQLLRGGNIIHLDVLNRAVELCREKTGACNWPAIPEGCWQQAYEELIG